MDLREIRSIVRSNIVRLMNNKDQFGQASHWTDTELNAYINQASKLFLEQTDILQDSDTVTVTNGVGTLPANIIKVHRVEIDNKPAGILYKHTYDSDWPVI